MIVIYGEAGLFKCSLLIIVKFQDIGFSVSKMIVDKICLSYAVGSHSRYRFRHFRSLFLLVSSLHACCPIFAALCFD